MKVKAEWVLLQLKLQKKSVQKMRRYSTISCIFQFDFSTVDNADTNTSKHHCLQTNEKMKMYTQVIVLLAFFVIHYRKIIV